MADITDTSPGFDAEMLVEPNASGAVPNAVTGGTYTFDASSERILFDSESLQRVTNMVDATGIRGTRCRHNSRIVTGTYSVSGSIVMRPGQDEIDLWLPRIMYGTEQASDKFPLADTAPATAYFAVLIDRVADIHQYGDCLVNRATFSASSGNPLVLTLEIIGMTESLPSWPGSPPNEWGVDEDADSNPILMSTGTLTLNSNTYQFEDFEVVIDNFLDAPFRNNETAAKFTPQDRLVTLRVNMDYTATSTLYGAETAIAGDIDFIPATNKSLKFNFGKLIAPKVSPVVTGKTPIMNNITFTAYGDDYTDYTDYELYITNDSTA